MVLLASEEDSAWRHSTQPPQGATYRQSEAGPGPGVQRVLRRQDAIVRRSLPTIASSTQSPFKHDADADVPDSILDTRARRNLFSDQGSNEPQQAQAWAAGTRLGCTQLTPAAAAPEPAAYTYTAINTSAGNPLPSTAYNLPSLRPCTPCLFPASTPYTTPLKHAPVGSLDARPSPSRPSGSLWGPAEGSEPDSHQPALKQSSHTILAGDYKLPFRTLWTRDHGGADSACHPHPPASEASEHGGEFGANSARPAEARTMQAVYEDVKNAPPAPHHMLSSSGGQPLRATLHRHTSMQPQHKSNSRLLLSQLNSSWTARASEPGQRSEMPAAGSDDPGSPDPITADIKDYEEDLQYVTPEELRYVMAHYGSTKSGAQGKHAPAAPAPAVQASAPRRVQLQRQTSLPQQPSSTRPGRPRAEQQPGSKAGSSRGTSCERPEETAAPRRATDTGEKSGAVERPGRRTVSRRATDTGDKVPERLARRRVTDTGEQQGEAAERSRERLSDTGLKSPAPSRAWDSQAAHDALDEEDLKYMTVSELQYAMAHGPGTGSKGSPMAKLQTKSSPQLRLNAVKPAPSIRSNVVAASASKPEAAGRLPPRGPAASEELPPARKAALGSDGKGSTPVKAPATKQSQQPLRTPAKTAPSIKSSAFPASFSFGAAGAAQETQAGSELPAEYEEDLKYLTAEELQYVMKQYRSPKPPPSQAGSSPHRRLGSNPSAPASKKALNM